MSKQKASVQRCNPAPEQGLTQEQVQQRIQLGLTNQLPRKTGQSVWGILRNHLFSYFNLVFTVMAVAMLLVGSSVLNLTFMVVVIINTAIGCVQQLRAMRAVDRLSLVAEQTVTVTRDGVQQQLLSRYLVLDDMVTFSTGDQICADGTLSQGQLWVNEALVTGEAEPVEKQPGEALLSGSFVVAGTGKARLTAVGTQAYAARLAFEAKKDPKTAKSEMMAALDKLIKIIGIGLIPVGALLFFSQRDAGLRSAVTATVAALVGMIPEGLYLLTSVALALSALKLTKSRVLVQDVNCIEALARTDVLCVDKTGTITAPELEFHSLIPLGDHSEDALRRVLAALFDTPGENETSKALWAQFSGQTPYVCSRRIPFTSETKYCGGLLEGQGLFLVGAPDRLLQDEQILARAEALIREGYRVLLAVHCPGDTPDPVNAQPLALLTLTGQLRPGARETFAYFTAQGVTVKVISGDHPAAAALAARQAGIPDADNFVDATTLDTPEKLSRAALSCTVFGRVTPQQKKQLVAALQQAGHTVAMTGDGVNDVLAMQEAACSLAMAGGARAASQVARLVLLDGDFSRMPPIVAEGRRVINNILRAASLFLVKNIFSLGMALITLFSGLPFPMESFHMSIVSSLTIGIPGFFLALEPNYERVRDNFLGRTLRGALPGGLTDLLAVVIAQGMMTGLQLPQADGQAVTTALLCWVGLMVLFRVCTPFTRLRRLVWGAMAICVAGAFLVLPPLTGYLTIVNPTSWLVMLCMLLLATGLFLVINRLFQLTDNIRKKRYT